MSRYKEAATLQCDRRIWGPPGCGKTYTSTRDVAERARDAERVTAVTFRSDMVDDLTRGLQGAGVAPCEDGAKWPWVGTVHGVARRLLEYDMVDCAFRTSPRDGDDGDVAKRKMKDHARDFFQEWRNGAVPYSAKSSNRLTDPGGVGELGDLFLGLRSWRIHTEKRKAVEMWHNWPEIVDRHGSEAMFQEFREKWSQFKLERGVWDWDDLLLDVQSFGVSPPPGAMFVDEAQDNSPFIHRILASWAEEMEFVVVAGDGNQAIYSFIGADPALFFDETEGSEEVFLGTTHRVPKATWNFAENALQVSGHRVPELGFKKQQGGAAARSTWTEFQNSLSQVGALRSVFYLVRCNFQIEQVAKLLRRSGIPFKAPGPYGWSGKDVRLFNAVVKARRKETLTPSEALELVDTYPSGDDAVRCVKKGFRESPKEVSALNWSQVFGPRVEKWVASSYPLKHSLATVSEAQETRIHAALDRLNDEVIDEVGHEVSTIHGAKGREAGRVYLFDGITPTIEDAAWPLHDEPEEARVWYVAASRHLEELLVVDYPETLASPFLQGGLA